MTTLYFSSMIMLGAVGLTKARNSRFDRAMDTFNEARFLILSYHIMLFTDYVTLKTTQFNIGHSCSAVLLIGLAVNMTMLVVDPVRLVRRSVKICYAKREQRRSLKVNKPKVRNAAHSFHARRKKRV